MAKHILVVDDDALLRRSLSLQLEQVGYRTSTAASAEDALALSKRDRPDLILLDVGLPGMDGLEALRQFQMEDDVPVIFVTARRRELDTILGLELGADDYITKPFSPRELAARVRAVLRRADQETNREPTEMRFDDLVIDRRSHQVRVQDRAVALTPTEFSLLEVLAGEPGRAFSRLELLDRVFGFDFEGFERTVDVHIKNLRKKIEPNPKQPTYIQTVYGLGYRFNP